VLSHEHDKRIHPLKTIGDRNIMEQKIKSIIQQFYRASEEESEELKNELISMVNKYGKSSVVSALESGKKKELLRVQWKIEEVLEIINPPKKVEEVEDDPSSRRLRMSEIELRYADPRGLRLYSSKVDSRWVMMRMDPQTGGMMQQEIDGSQAQQIQQQLAGSPYWLNNQS
tara:strand:- start:236 stop:748 length:513 start_codon:yes stop_codon:yes gene_type:complete